MNSRLELETVTKRHVIKSVAVFFAEKVPITQLYLTRRLRDWDFFCKEKSNGFFDMSLSDCL